MAKKRKRIAFTAWGFSNDLTEAKNEIDDKRTGLLYLSATPALAKSCAQSGESPVQFRIEEIE